MYLNTSDLYFEDLVISPRSCYIAFYYDLEIDEEAFKVELLRLSILFGVVSEKIEEIDDVLEGYVSIVLDKYREIGSLLGARR